MILGTPGEMTVAECGTPHLCTIACEMHSDFLFHFEVFDQCFSVIVEAAVGLKIGVCLGVCTTNCDAIDSCFLRVYGQETQLGLISELQLQIISNC